MDHEGCPRARPWVTQGSPAVDIGFMGFVYRFDKGILLDSCHSMGTFTGLTSWLLARGNHRYRDHDPWLSLHALEFCLPFLFHETVGFQDMVGDDGFILGRLCVLVWPLGHHEAGRSHKHPFALRRSSIPRGDNWFREADSADPCCAT